MTRLCLRVQRPWRGGGLNYVSVCPKICSLIFYLMFIYLSASIMYSVGDTLSSEVGTGI